MREILGKPLEESEANRLPSLPHVLIKLLQACRDENICFDTITDIISKDTALCAKVIAVVNSPVYGHARHLNNFKHILLFLGLDTIKSIAITASVQQFFSKYSNQKSRFLKQFWRHALNCATIARSLAKLTSYKYVEEAYLAGLLHDIGKLVMVSHADFDYSNLAHGEHPADGLLKLELENFQISHDELGARLLSRWDVTDAICDAVRFHHATADDIQEAHQLVKILNLSNILASKNVLNNPLRIETATQLFDLSDSLIRDIIHQSEEEVENVARSMDIDIGYSDSNTDNRDEQKQIELAQEVRDITLSRSSRLPGYHDESSTIYQSIQKSIMILFGIKESLIFRCDHATQTLVVAAGQPMNEHSLIHDLSIPFDSNSLLSNVVNHREIQDSFHSEKLPVVDRQILGYMNTDGFICIPAIRSDQVVALMVMGINQNKQASFTRNQNLLKLFAQDAASQIEQAESQARLREEVTTSSHNLYRAKAREIIHETNNPLSVIRNYLQILARRLDSNDPAQDEIKIIKEEIDRVGSIILRCADDINVDSALSSTQGFDINDLIKDINNIFKSSLYITHNIKSKLHLGNNTGSLYFSKDTIKQVITNLVKNAVEAMEDSGSLDISTRNININGRDYIDIEIRDDGPGIPDEILKNLYSPVTSTKGKGHSGLGLSIVKNLIDGLGGFISCRTGESGTIFNVQIPRNENI